MSKPYGLGCSPIYEKSFVGDYSPPIVIPIKDSYYRGEHPNLCLFCSGDPHFMPSSSLPELCFIFPTGNRSVVACCNVSVQAKQRFRRCKM